jgi:non-specific serine/threonine protein kinase
VFAGGWTLEAAEAVCAGEPIATKDVLDLLSHLVDKSLVVAEERGAAAWYRLLDPLRAHALEKLQHSGDELRVQSRHRDWYVQLAERFEAEWRGPQQRVWFDSLEREEANIRVALRGCLDRGEITEGLRLAAALHRFWDLRSRMTEGRAWLAELLRVMSPATPDSVTAKALGRRGVSRRLPGRHPTR